MSELLPPPQKAAKVVPVPTLHFPEGPLAGTMVRLDQDLATLGRRTDNAYVVAEPGVSRVHAEFRKEAGAVIVTDLGSAGGTKLNGTTITGPSVLAHGDTITFGAVTATFEDPATSAEGEDQTQVMDVPEVATGPHLSPRQQQVLERMAQGMTNSEIGTDLGVTERTIKAYAQELYDKLGVRNRAGAVSQGVKLGFL